MKLNVIGSLLMIYEFQSTELIALQYIAAVWISSNFLVLLIFF